jgi:hypothetical protein
MYSYTGDTPQDESNDNVSTSISYIFVLMDQNAFGISSSISEYTCDTNTAVIIPFRIYSGSTGSRQARGVVLDSNGDTVSGFTLNRTVQSNVQNYWSLGKIPTAGEYTIRL